MPRSIAVFGAGSGLGQAIARRYGREGYDVVLVARRQVPLDLLARDLSTEGIAARAVTADLSETDGVAALAARIRAEAGPLTALYYGPAPADPGFVSAADLTPERLRALMPMTVYTLIALVREFLPEMVERGEGAVLSAQGASAVTGWAHMSGWPPALAAQRNYLQSLAAEVTDRGVYVGMLHIGARIVGSAADAKYQATRAAGTPVPEMVAAEPSDLADLLWTMHVTGDSEAVFPAGLLDT
jgi:short-subunit dehydrogenase